MNICMMLFGFGLLALAPTIEIVGYAAGFLTATLFGFGLSALTFQNPDPAQAPTIEIVGYAAGFLMATLFSFSLLALVFQLLLYLIF